MSDKRLLLSNFTSPFFSLLFALFLLTASAPVAWGGLPDEPLSGLSEVSAKALPAVVDIQIFCEGYNCGSGSGFLIDPEGRIITNYHVVADADRITVRVPSRDQYSAVVTAASKHWDLALLSIDGTNLPYLPMQEDTASVRIGESVIAVGSPQGLDGTVSDGIISGFRDGPELGIPDFSVPLLQTTAPFSPGSSGGPLLNMRGEVIGVNVLMLAESQSLNFALPVDVVHEFLGRAELPAYTHKPGDLAAVLDWNGPFDLDLEIWTADLEFLGTASALGRSPDATSGSGVSEWFVFEEYTDGDFSQGTFVVSPYFHGPYKTETVNAVLTAYLPDGETITVEQELAFMPPRDQWHAMEINVESASVKILDLFPEPRAQTGYSHTPGELAVLLHWEGDFDLDLELWTEDFEYLGNASWIADTPDAQTGAEAPEWFVFDSYLDAEYSTGRYIVSPYFYGPVGDDAVTAHLTVVFRDGERMELRRSLYYEPPRDQWFAVLVDVDTGEVNVLDTFDRP